MGLLQLELQRAIETGEFIPNFQPLVDLRTGQLEGFEVLARWQHPVLGLLMPKDFVPIIERYNLAIELSACMLERAFVAIKPLPAHLGLSINAAPEQFRDHALSQTISMLALEAGFDLRRLTVELTESALVDDLPLAGSIAAELKNLGCRLALDDFGTGYSSLLHLQSLPFDELKVDRSFITSMVESAQSRKIVAAVLGLGHSLGLRTVAEGVEFAEQSDLLTGQGCDIGQGWFFGRPVPAADLPGLVDQIHQNSKCKTNVSPTPSATASTSAPAPFFRIPVKPLSPLQNANSRVIPIDFSQEKLA